MSKNFFIADMHFAPTEKSKQSLLNEGKNEKNIYKIFINICNFLFIMIE